MTTEKCCHRLFAYRGAGAPRASTATRDQKNCRAAFAACQLHMGHRGQA
jgi:hypothetical protein